jgi:rhodanese-related sulfurtransferase
MFQTADHVKHIYAEDLYNNIFIRREQIIDIREPYEIKEMSLEGTLHIPMNTLYAHPEKFLSRKTIYYLLCRSGRRSYDLAEILGKKGYKVVNVVGGILVIEELKARET